MFGVRSSRNILSEGHHLRWIRDQRSGIRDQRNPSPNLSTCFELPLQRSLTVRRDVSTATFPQNLVAIPAPVRDRLRRYLSFVL